MFSITYTCMKCGREEGDIKSFICKCGGEFRGTGMPAVTNTMDSFGIGRGFYDHKTNQMIDNFSKWEKAGFREPGSMNCKNSGLIKEKVKYAKSHKTYQTRSKAIEMADRI